MRNYGEPLGESFLYIRWTNCLQFAPQYAVGIYHKRSEYHCESLAGENFPVFTKRSFVVTVFIYSNRPYLLPFHFSMKIFRFGTNLHVHGNPRRGFPSKNIPPECFSPPPELFEAKEISRSADCEDGLCPSTLPPFEKGGRKLYNFYKAVHYTKITGYWLLVTSHWSLATSH